MIIFFVPPAKHRAFVSMQPLPQVVFSLKIRPFSDHKNFSKIFEKRC